MQESDKQRIYNAIKQLLKAYAPPYLIREGKNVSGKDSFGLWAEGKFEAFGRTRTEMYLAGVIMQKTYVGFYLMPMYSDAEYMQKVVSPQLLKCLKGKSCFYIKDDSKQTLADIEHALTEGYKLYKQRGWV